jgi:hypothetical protein
MMFEYGFHWLIDNKRLRTHLLFHLYLEFNTNTLAYFDSELVMSENFVVIAHGVIFEKNEVIFHLELYSVACTFKLFTVVI